MEESARGLAAASPLVSWPWHEPAPLAADPRAATRTPIARSERYQRIAPAAIDQRRLLVGERSERYEMEVAGSDLAVPQRPLYVRPAIRTVYRRRTVREAWTRSSALLARVLPTPGLRLLAVLVTAASLYALAVAVRP